MSAAAVSGDLSIPLTDEVIAFARAVVAAVDGPPPLRLGERVTYSPGHGWAPQEAIVRAIGPGNRVQIRTLLEGMRAGETVHDWYCRTVSASDLTRGEA